MGSMDSRSILIIEDDHDIRVTFRAVLESRGFKVVSCTNGQDAKHVLQKNFHPQLIILDLSMPLMSGEDFLEWKNAVEKLRDVPTIVVSSFPERLKVVSGVNKIHKPLELEDFLNRVNAVMQTSEPAVGSDS